MKNFEDMTFDEKVNWSIGKIAMSIGEGKVREMMSLILMATTQDAFDRGRKSVEQGKVHK